MRIAYIDEAGISNLAQEPFLVLAGVILNGDQDWLLVDRHIKSMIRRHFKDRPVPYEFTFHAKDIWHGSGHFDRRVWPREERNAIMVELASIPKRFHLTVVVGCINRIEIRDKMRQLMPRISDQQVDTWSYVEAYAQMVSEADNWMEHNARNEVLAIIAEDTPRVKQAVKMLHSGMVNDDESSDGYDVLNPRHLIDTVHFATKPDSSILQIADTCAFVCKRVIMGKSDTMELFNHIKSQLISQPRDCEWKVQAWPIPRFLRLRLPRSWTTDANF